MRTKLVLPVLMLAATVYLYPQQSQALQFTPTDQEWAKWPDYCRARFVVSGKGRSSTRHENDADVKAWEAKMGPDAWYGLHHHCAGLAYLQRGLSLPPGVKRDGNIEAAVRNHEYMLKNLPSAHFLYPDVVANLAAAYIAWGKPDKAFESLDKAIEAQPESPVPYINKARLQKKMGDASKSRQTLEAADMATKGTSAEIKYALGLDYFKANDLQRAQSYAREAYALGYPLPWLRDQLRSKGLSVDPLPAVKTP
jgi:tetratricopeptide (TPR) repeat protein